MEKKESLTKEAVRKKFKSQFELVNYAIKLSEQMIRSGRAPMVSSESENTAVIIIDEIACGKDKFEEVLISKEIIKEPQDLKNGSEVLKESPMKSTEKKKTRRILA